MKHIWRVMVGTMVVFVGLLITNVSVNAQVQSWSQANLSEARTRLVSTSVGELALFAGGDIKGQYSDYPTDVIDIYNSVNEQWTVAHMTGAYRLEGAVSVGNVAMFLTKSNSVEIYDSVTGGWTNVSLSNCSGGKEDFILSDQEKVYIGANNGSQLCVYDGQTKTWSYRLMTPMQFGSTDTTITTLGDKVLFAGGMSTYLGFSNLVYLYDVSDNYWRVLPNLSEKKFGMAATGYGNQIAVAGGEAQAVSGSAGSRSVDIYNLETGTKQSSSLSAPGSGLTAVSYGNLAFFVGGRGCDGFGSCYFRSAVDMYNFSTNTRSTDPRQIYGAELTSVVVGNKVLFAGGTVSSIYLSTVNIATMPQLNSDSNADAGVDQVGDEGSSVNFDGSGSTDPDGVADIVSYNWDFGDGQYGSGVAASHVYPDNGVYTASLTVMDTAGHMASDTIMVTVNNVVPVVSGVGGTIEEGGVFSSTGSLTDPGTDMWSATVDYGDGSGVQALSLTGKNFDLSHQYLDNGNYSVSVSVLDDDGGVGIAMVSVTVNNVVPAVGSLTPMASVLPGVSVSTGASFTDPGTLDTHTASYDWGDGGSTVGTVSEVGGSGSVSGIHSYSAAGTYNVTLTVRDNDGGSTVVSTSVTILTSAQATQNLIDLVQIFNLQQGIENSLDAKLEAAVAAFSDLNVQNEAAAVNALQAFINAVEAQRGNKITSAQADQLISVAQQILSSL